MIGVCLEKLARTPIPKLLPYSPPPPQVDDPVVKRNNKNIL